MPAPNASALADGYVEEVEAIAVQLNRLRPEAIQTFRFGSQSDFTRTMMNLIEEAEVPA
jgi:hypothetical protein